MREFALLIVERKPRDVESGRKAALRAQAEPIHIDKFAGFPYTALELVDRFELLELCADHPKDNLLVLWHESQRGKVTGPVGIVFQKIGVDVHPTEQEIGNRFVSAAGNPRPGVPPAEMHADPHALRTTIDDGVDEV